MVGKARSTVIGVSAFTGREPGLSSICPMHRKTASLSCELPCQQLMLQMTMLLIVGACKTLLQPLSLLNIVITIRSRCETLHCVGTLQRQHVRSRLLSSLRLTHWAKIQP